MSAWICWAGFFVVLLIAMAIVAKRRKRIDDAVEDAAAAVLPRIGKLAERKYHARYGQAAASPPSGSWYPSKGDKLHSV